MALGRGAGNLAIGSAFSLDVDPVPPVGELSNGSGVDTFDKAWEITPDEGGR